MGKSLDRMRLAFIYSQTLLEMSIIAWAGSSVGRAPALQAGGHRFEPCSAYHIERPRGRSSVWLERRPVTPEVASSSLVGPAIFKQPIVLGRQAVFCFLTNKNITIASKASKLYRFFWCRLINKPQKPEEV